MGSEVLTGWCVLVCGLAGWCKASGKRHPRGGFSIGGRGSPRLGTSGSGILKGQIEGS